MANRTPTQLRTAVRQLANVENSQFVKDAEIDDRVQEQISDLWDLLQSKFEHYGAKTYAFSLSSANATSLPSDFYKEILLEKTPGPHSQPIHPVSYLERNFKRGFIVGDDLSVWPMNNFAGDYQLTYTPQSPVITPQYTAFCATTTPLVGYSVNGVVGYGHSLHFSSPGPMTIDDKTPIGGFEGVGSVVLIKNEVGDLATNNGLYWCAENDPGGVTFNRIQQFSNNQNIRPSSIVAVTDGTVNGGSAFELTSQQIDVDVLPLVWDVAALPNCLQPYYEYIQVAAAITVVEKRGRDSSKLVARLARLYSRIEGAAANRTEEAPDMPVTSPGGRRGRNGFWGWDC